MKLSFEAPVLPLLLLRLAVGHAVVGPGLLAWQHGQALHPGEMKTFLMVRPDQPQPQSLRETSFEENTPPEP